MNTVYLIIDEKKGVCLAKVGCTADLQTRLQAYKTHNPMAEVVSIQNTQERTCRRIEDAYHAEFRTLGFYSVGLPPKRGRMSEWFIIPYDSEFYNELKTKGLDAFKASKGRKTYNLKGE